MNNYWWCAILFRICLPCIIASAGFFRPTITSYVYMVMGCYMPFFSVPTNKTMAGSTGTYLKLLIIACMLMCSMVFSVYFVLYFPDEAEYDLEPCSPLEIAIRTLGIVEYRDMPFKDTITWCLPEPLMLATSILLYWSLKKLTASTEVMKAARDMKGTELMDEINRKKMLDMMSNFGKYLVCFMLCCTAILKATAFGAIYYVVFLGVMTYWACNHSLGKVYARILVCLVPIVYLNITIMFIYQFQYFYDSKEFQTLSIWGRLFNLVELKTYKDCTDPRLFKFHSQSNSAYAMPFCLFFLYQISILVARQILGAKDGVINLLVQVFHRESTKDTSARWRLALRKLEKKMEMEKSAQSYLLVDKIKVIVDQIFEFILSVSYLAANFIMMLWAIVYVNWRGLILLSWANIIWLLPARKKVMLVMSPFLVLYVHFLLMTTYLYSMDLTRDELPSQLGIINFEAGIEQFSTQKWVDRLTKSLFGVIIFVAMRQLWQERGMKKQETEFRKSMGSSIWGSEIDRDKLKSPLIDRMRDQCFKFFAIWWIWIVIITMIWTEFWGSSNLFRITFVGLAALFLLTFQFCSFDCWKKFLRIYWWIVITYAMFILFVVYLYQFAETRMVLHKYHIKKKFETFGFKIWPDAKSRFIALLKPLFFQIAIVIQQNFLQEKFNEVTSPISPEELTQEEENLDDNSSAWSKITNLFNSAKNVFFAVLEVHLKNVILLIGWFMCLFDLCAIFVPFVILFTAACVLQKTFSTYIIYVISCCLQILIIARLIYMNQIVDHKKWDYVGHYTRKGVPYNVSLNTADWLGFHESSYGRRYADFWQLIWCFGYVFAVTLHRIVTIRMKNYRLSRNLESSQQTVLFPEITYENCHDNTENMLMFLANYGFYKFGCEITLIYVSIVMGIRMDGVAILLSFWLLILFALNRVWLKRIWLLGLIWLCLIVPAQYMSTLGWWPSFFNRSLTRFWNSNDFLLRLQQFFYLMNMAHPPIKAKISLDYIMLLLASRQWIAFKTEWNVGAQDSAAGTNENVSHLIDDPDVKNPVPDFNTYTKTPLDSYKRMFFKTWFYISLMAVFLAGAMRPTLYSFGYILGAFVFLWQGSEFYLRPPSSILYRWNLLITYNILVMITRTISQIFGCCDDAALIAEHIIRAARYSVIAIFKKRYQLCTILVQIFVKIETKLWNLLITYNILVMITRTISQIFGCCDDAALIAEHILSYCTSLSLIRAARYSVIAIFKKRYQLCTILVQIFVKIETKLWNLLITYNILVMITRTISQIFGCCDDAALIAEHILSYCTSLSLIRAARYSVIAIFKKRYQLCTILVQIFVKIETKLWNLLITYNILVMITRTISQIFGCCDDAALIAEHILSYCTSLSLIRAARYSVIAIFKKRYQLCTILVQIFVKIETKLWNLLITYNILVMITRTISQIFGCCDDAALIAEHILSYCSSLSLIRAARYSVIAIFKKRYQLCTILVQIFVKIETKLWNLLIAYNILVMITRTISQIFGCILKYEIPLNCAVYRIFTIGCVDKYGMTKGVPNVSKTSFCEVSYHALGMGWDCFCFFCLICQQRIFKSFHFIHMVNEVKAHVILADRGAELIEANRIKKKEAVDNEIITIQNNIKKKMQRINANSDKIEAIRAGEYYLFDQVEKDIDIPLLPPKEDEDSDYESYDPMPLTEYFGLFYQTDITTVLDITAMRRRRKKALMQKVEKRGGAIAKSSKPGTSKDPDTDPELPKTTKILHIIQFCWGAFESFIVSVTGVINRRTSDFRSILNEMYKDRVTLNEKTNYKQGVRLGSDMIWQPSELYKNILNEQAILYLILTYSEWLCYLMIILYQVIRSNLISLPLVIMTFCWGSLTVPKPTKTFWIIIIAYILVMVFLKNFFTMGLAPWKVDALEVNIFFPPTIIGLHDKYSILNFFLLITVFFHRVVLQMLGLWKPFKYRVSSVVKDGNYYFRGGKLVPVSTDSDKSQQPLVVTSVHVSMGEYFPKSIIHGVSRYAEGFRLYMQQLVSPSSTQIPVDVYTPMFFCDLINMCILMFYYGSFQSKSNDMGLVEFVGNNRVPLDFIMVVLVYFFLIMIDRGLYLRRNRYGKLIYHFLQVIGCHIWLFILYPMATNKRLDEVVVVQIFYVLKCSYFLFSAYQIRNGYPTLVSYHHLWHGYTLFHSYGYKIYRSIPYLLEIRSLLDWMCSDSCLGIPSWFKLEDITQSLFSQKCQQEFEEKWARPAGRRYSRSTKYLVGGILYAILILTVIFPFLLFSLSSTMGVKTRPQKIKMELYMGTAEPIFSAYPTEKDLKELSEDDYQKLSATFNTIKASEKIFGLFKAEDILVVKWSGHSLATWDISPGSKEELLEALYNDMRFPIRLQLHYTHVGHGGELVERTFGQSTIIPPLPSIYRQNLIDMVKAKNGTDTVTRLPLLIPKFLMISKESFPFPLSLMEDPGDIDEEEVRPTEEDDDQDLPPDPKRLRNLLIALQMDREYWWQIKEECEIQDDNYLYYLKNLVYNDCDSVVIYFFNEKVFSDAKYFMMTQSGILGLYLLYFMVVIEIIRGCRIEVGEIWLNDLPNSNKVLRKCLEIYVARDMKNFELEREIFEELICIMRSREMLIKLTRYDDNNYDPTFITPGSKK